MIHNLPTTVKEEKEIAVLEASVETGVSEKKIKAMAVKHNLSVARVMDGIFLAKRYERSYYSVCMLLKNHTPEEVEEILILADTTGQNMISLSKIFQHFGGVTVDEVEEFVSEVCGISCRRFRSSAVADAIEIAATNPDILYLDSLLDEFKSFHL